VLTPPARSALKLTVSTRANTKTPGKASAAAESFSVFDGRTRRPTLDGVSNIFTAFTGEGQGSKIMCVVGTVDGVVVGTAAKGELPVSVGWNSAPISVTMSPYSTLSLHLSTGQVVALTAAALDTAKGTSEETTLLVPPQSQAMQKRLEEGTTEVVAVETFGYVAKLASTQAAAPSPAPVSPIIKDGGIMLLVLLLAVQSRGFRIPLTPPCVDDIDPLHAVAAYAVVLLASVVYRRVKGRGEKSARSYDVTITRLDLPVVVEDKPEHATDDLPQIPQRFINGTVDQGGMQEAERRWRLTHEWRKKEGIEDLLLTPFPEFRAIKEAYPLFYCARTKAMFPDGEGGMMSHVCYYEQIGKVDVEKCSAIGMKPMQKFLKFVVEYVYTYNAPFENSKIFNVVDVKDFAMSEVKGDFLTLFKFVTSLSQEHYMERASVICVVNAPMWFSMIWKVIKPLINENTQKKVRILGAKDTFKGLCEFIAPENIPEEYGGELVYRNDAGEKVSVRDSKYGSELERAVYLYVDRMNKGEPLPRPPHFDREDVTSLWKEREAKRELWDSDIGDPSGPTDVHVWPVALQKSKFAREANGTAREANGAGDSVVVGGEGGEAVPEVDFARVRKDSTIGLSERGFKKEYGDSDEEDSDDEERRDMRRRRKEMGSSATINSEDGERAVSVGWLGGGEARIKSVLMEGWINKKATGEGFFGRRNWASRWAKLVIGVPPTEEGGVAPAGGIEVPMLLMYWYEYSPSPSSFIVLDQSIVVPVERPQMRVDGAEEENKHCFDIVHLPAKRVTRSFSSINVASRDEWVKKINVILNRGREEGAGGES